MCLNLLFGIYLFQYGMFQNRKSVVLMVNCCYVHICFVQVTICGAFDALTRLGARTILLLSHLLGSQNKYQ